MALRLDSRSLALFLAVADAASIRQAAERLHVSQPPLSRSIRELEERLGCRLFERHAGGVALTAAGRALRPYALKIERLLIEAEKVASGPVASMRIRLGFTSALDPAWFNKLVELAGACFQEQGLDVVWDTSPRLVRLLRSGRLDAACIALPTQTGELHVHEVDRSPMLVALPSTHELARRRRLRLIDLAATPMFWFERARQPAFYDHCERVFARHGLTARRLGEPSDHHVLLGAVAAGRGVALLPASFVGIRRAGVCYRQLEEGDELAIRIGLAAPPDRQALLQQFAQLIERARDGASRR